MRMTSAKQGLRRLAVALTVLALLSAATTAPATDAEDLELLQRTSKAFASVARQATPAVVFISVQQDVAARRSNMPNDRFHGYGNPGFEDFLRQFFGEAMPHDETTPEPRYRRYGQGSGFLISKDGYILTNNHVVRDADRIEVTTSNGRVYMATRIGADPKSEVAIIKIEGAEDFPTVAIGRSNGLEIGEWVIAIGNPFGLSETLTVGVVSALGRTRVGIADYEEFIQTDAAINPGNSGGPLLNIHGEVVGINTAIYSQSGGYMGIGFAIPIDMAMAIKDQLIDSGKVVRGYLGVHIQDITPALAESFGLDSLEGILIADVEPDSGAAAAGLLSGDVILKLNGAPAGNVGTFRNRVSSHAPGSELTLTLIRDGERKTLQAEVGSMPGEPGAPETARQAELMVALGFTVQELTADSARRLGYNAGDGVLVSEVTPDGAAAAEGLRAGDLITSVNRRVIGSLGDFHEALKGSGSSRSVLLRIQRGRMSRYVVVRLPAP